MKKIIESSWLAYFKVITNPKKAFILVITLWIIAMLIACGGSKKTITKNETFEKEETSDSLYSHAKDYIDTSIHETFESSDFSVVRYYRPIIIIDSLGRRNIVADSMIENNAKRQASTKEKKGINTHETLYVHKQLRITEKRTVYITKTVVHKSKWLIWMLIGAGLCFLVLQFGPKIFQYLKRLIFPVPV